MMLKSVAKGQQPRIPKRPFGSIHKNDRLPQCVSIIGLGCSSFSTFFLNQDDLSANTSSNNELTVDRLDHNHPLVMSWIDAIEYAITVAGITVLDTAPWYGHGTSEVVVGFALTKLFNEGKIKREQLTINTKIGRYEADPTKQFDFSAAATINSVERSIRRLCCGSYIDVLQLHDPEFAPSMDILFRETIPAMIECQKKGWCRALGITGTFNVLFYFIFDKRNVA
jgi:aryl-alcohol dehydrogenase-like predicted oxidoreductase